MANKILNRMVAIIDHCMANHKAWYIENPRDSRLWETSIMQEPERRSSATKSRWDYCQLVTTYMKLTIIMAWQNEAFIQHSKTCDFGAHNQWHCSKNGARHERLEGFDEHGKARTSYASAYPPQLCECWANLIINRKRASSRTAPKHQMLGSLCGLGGK